MNLFCLIYSLILLQIPSSVTDKAFDTSPTTVYGVLVGVLLSLLIYQLYLNAGQAKYIREQDKQNLVTLTGLVNTLQALRETKENTRKDMVEHIDRAEDNILKAVQHVSEKIVRK